MSVDLLVWETLSKGFLVRNSLWEDFVVLNLLSVHPLVRNALSEDALEEEEEKQAEEPSGDEEMGEKPAAKRN